jgi:hypothetical protein
MRKAIAVAFAAGFATLVAGASRSADAASIYTVKFVCGTQRPLAGSAAPVEPPVKPGNYATVINVEGLTQSDLVTHVITVISLAGSTGTVAGPILDVNAFLTQDITCADIAAALKLPPSTTFITGFVDLEQNSKPLSVTAVYTTQGCIFPPLTNVITVLPPICGGASDIDVVPQTPIPLTNSAS